MEPATKPVNGKLVALIAMYAATCVASAYMLILIPNIEFFTMMIFLGGLLFGRAIGATNGFLASLLYFVFNIYGLSPLPLLGIQVGAYTLLGFTGGVLKGASFVARVTPRSQAMFGLIGVAFVLAYTLVADFTFSVIMGINFLAWVLQGMIFTLLLVASNLITFALLLPLVLVPVQKQVASLFPSLEDIKVDESE